MGILIQGTDLKIPQQRLDDINGPFSEIVCNVVRNDAGIRAASRQQLEEEIALLKQNNPGLDTDKLWRYLEECGGVPKAKSGSSFLLWTGVLGAMGVGLYLMTKGK